MRVLAIAHQPLEHCLDRGQVGNAGIDLASPAPRELAGAHVTAAVVQLQQRRDVVEREAERLRALDEPQPVDLRCRG